MFNTGNNNVGIGLTGDGLSGFSSLNSGAGNTGFFNSGTANTGLFNSGTGNTGLFNSGTGNVGIGNTGTGNTGIGNSGNYNTGLLNAGLVNTGIANPGNHNTGLFNIGTFNTGIANPGHYNTGSYNTGSYNTGMANAGDYGTGAFITGSMNNGLLWRADRQGLLAANYTITIERPAAFLNVDIPVNIPITGDITNVSIPAITFPRIDASGSVDIGILSGTVLAPVGPITLHGGDASAPLDTPIEIDFGPSPAINLNIGKPDGSTVINIVGGAARPDQHSDHRLAASARLLQRHHRPVVGLPQLGCWQRIGLAELRQQLGPLQLRH